MVYIQMCLSCQVYAGENVLVLLEMEMNANVCNRCRKCCCNIWSSACFSCAEQLARWLMSTVRRGELWRKQARGVVFKKGKAFAGSANKLCARDSFPLFSISAKHYMAFTENGFCRWQHALERFQRAASAKRVGLYWRLGTLVVFSSLHLPL